MHHGAAGVTIGGMPGQTLGEIRSLLAGAGLAPRHRYGQNFLIDLNLMRKVVDAAEVRPDDVILEVGPGTGSLTELLLERGAQVVAVEIDRGLQTLIAQRLGGERRFALVAGDVLAGKSEINPAVVDALRARPPGAGGTYKLVANLPYQIATPLLMDLLLGPLRFERLVCTIQKEVGERLLAPAGSDAYGPVSVLTETLAEARLAAHLPPEAFWPRPKVESVLIALRSRERSSVDVEDVAGFAAFVQRAFQQRRKTMRRILREMSDERTNAEDVLRLAEISSDCRPEQLSPPVWRQLHRAWRACWGS